MALISGTLRMAAGLARRNFAVMMWKTIRLELAKTDEFPRGSPSRSYLLRLPLGEDGAIDEAELRQQPRHATVRRFWPSQPDLAGYVVRSSRGWEIAYDLDRPEAALGRIDGEVLRLGECVTLAEPNGRRLPFRVASVEALS